MVNTMEGFLMLLDLYISSMESNMATLSSRNTTNDHGSFCNGVRVTYMCALYSGL